MKRICCTFAMTALALAALAGCAGTYGPQALKTGASLNEVTSALGTPTGRYPRAGGERVEYARGPYGKHTYMLDFDGQGRLTSWEQVLTEEKFDTLRAGATRDELLFMLGHPSDRRALALHNRALWSYRYDGPFCKWFQVDLDAGGKVVATGYGPDPLCEDLIPAVP